jgi:hypothetical protein
MMKLFTIFFISLVVLSGMSSAATANDFGWTEDLNLQAQSDPSGFKVRLATRFKVGDLQVDAVLSNVDNPADAYILLRLGEISGKSCNTVIDKYRNNRKNGWGALAKSLGIKPGSPEFHALKRGHDLQEHNTPGKTYLSIYHRSSNSYAEDNYVNNNLKAKSKRRK